VAASEGTSRWVADGVEVETWFQVVGDLAADRAPLVVLHGGPGATHDYLAPLAGINGMDGRAVVLYDQVGNGRSTHRSDAPASSWTVDVFVRELHALTRSLGIGRHHVLGQSWGGMLAQEYAIGRPVGLRSLVLADTHSSMPDLAAEVARLRAALPDDDAFYAQHVCRLDPRPAWLDEAFACLDENPTVYTTMNGPTELQLTGSLRDWQSTERLGEIAVPTLLLSGRYDEMTPRLQQTMLDRIRDCEWSLLEQSSHMPHVEEPERFLTVVADWLQRHD
jgi:L-proline amide hydrolase